MSRYFIEVAYRGTRYSGFQVQENAPTIQLEIEKAFTTLHRQSASLTGSSRTDAGVHALQNFFHFDFEGEVHRQFVYKMNAILPEDIVVKNIFSMPAAAHSRFDAISRRYSYRVHRFKNPFIGRTSLYFPYQLDIQMMQKAADIIKGQKNFFSFSKTNSQVKTFECLVFTSEWTLEGNTMKYTIEANRFLRGMVRLITASLLKVGRGKLSVETFEEFFSGKTKCGFSVPAHGLFLEWVKFAENYFPAPGVDLKGF
jgi:tRNA pseudouridine38-40 synthase